MPIESNRYQRIVNTASDPSSSVPPCELYEVARYPPAMPVYLSRSEARAAAEACRRTAEFTRKDMERLGDSYTPAAESMRAAIQRWEGLARKFLAHAEGKGNVVPLRKPVP